MNDILPKPFTKEGLFGMLDVGLLVNSYTGKLISGIETLDSPKANAIFDRNTKSTWHLRRCDQVCFGDDLQRSFGQQSFRRDGQRR